MAREMNEHKSKYPKFLQSSVDANTLSLTVKGIIIALIPAIIIIGKYAGIEIVETQIMQSAEEITLALASLVTSLGLLRKASKHLDTKR